MRLPNVKRPCNECPFKTNALRGWLGKERIIEILNSKSFVCHKNKALQCAGHMLLKGDSNHFVELAERLGLDTGLTGRELIFSSDTACIRHHSKDK